MSRFRGGPGIDVEFAVTSGRVDPELAKVEQKIVAASRRIDRQMLVEGEKAGESYAKGIESRITKKLAAGAFKFAVIGLADSMLRGIADAIRQASTGEDVATAILTSVHTAMKHIPIVGAFSEIGEAIGNIIGDAIAAEITNGEFGKGPGRGMPGGTPLIDRRKDQFAWMTSVETRFDQEGEGGLSPSEVRRKRIKDERARLNNEAYRLGIADPDSWTESLFNAAMANADRLDSEEADRKRKQDTLAKLRNGIDTRQDKLSLIRDMMGAMPQLTAASFISTAQTAIGGFRFGQRDSAQILADNTKTMVGLQKDANKILEEIKDLQSQQDALR